MIKFIFQFTPWPLMRTKDFALSVILGALGNVIGIASLEVFSVISPQVALDLSHYGTFLSAAILGPKYGLLTGLIVSISPYIRFGLQGIYGPIFGALIFPGKAMTGYFSGLLMKRTRPIVAVILGYVPESIFTYLTMAVWAPMFLSQKALAVIPPSVIALILAKAWVEVIVLAFLAELSVKKLCGRIVVCYCQRF